MNNSRTRRSNFSMAQRLEGFFYRLKSHLAIEPCGYCGYADDPDVICHVCFHTDGVKSPGAVRRFLKRTAKHVPHTRAQQSPERKDESTDSLFASTKTAWVLRLREEAKLENMTGNYYFSLFGTEEGYNWLTRDLDEAELYEDKEAAIQEMKDYESLLLDEYGIDSPMLFGYTSTMKHFKFVEVDMDVSTAKAGGEQYV